VQRWRCKDRFTLLILQLLKSSVNLLLLIIAILTLISQSLIMKFIILKSSACFRYYSNITIADLLDLIYALKAFFARMNNFHEMTEIAVLSSHTRKSIFQQFFVPELVCRQSWDSWFANMSGIPGFENHLIAITACYLNLSLLPLSSVLLFYRVRQKSPKSFSLFSQQPFAILIWNFTVLFPETFYI